MTRLRLAAALLAAGACVGGLGLNSLDSQEPEADGPLRFTERERSIIQTLSPLPPLPQQASNRWADDPAAARFGQRLFYDARLSREGDRSCASCHSPGLGWSDGLPRAEGRNGALIRNSPSLLHSGYQRWLFWDGRADSLWAQVQWPLEHPDEMGFARADLVRLLARDASLRRDYEELFGPLPEGAADAERFRPGGRPPLPRPSDPFNPAPSLEQLAETDPGHAAWLAMSEADRRAASEVLSRCAKAIEAFERRLVPGPSAFDRFVEGLREDDAQKQGALSRSAQRGLRIFVGKGNCVNCHFSPLLSGGEFHNIGLAVAAGEPFDAGRPDGINTVRVDPMNGRGEFSDAQEWASNVKLRYLRYDEHTFGAYKAPTLRNAAVSAPYMHDGRFATLEEVVRFYVELPGLPPVGHREETLLPVPLDEGEIQDLVAFLESLRGTPVDEQLRRPLEPTEDD
ncbi:MAG: cytochrome-c peroxidase [Planctomycetes bacterium]|nr:cytochrome-c peroxidase [Planctomycetota bacterium]